MIEKHTTKEEQPLVSIVMSVYKDKEYLPLSIESILDQTLRNFEFIIVSDGAGSDTLKILKEYSSKDTRIKLLIFDKNRGLAACLNDGIAISKGKYIARMDGDDISMKDRLKKQVEFLDKNEEIFLVGCSVNRIDSNGNILSQYFPPRGKNINKVLESSNPMVHPSIMFRNNGRVKYREKFKAVQDYDLYLRLVDDDLVLENMSEVLLNYRMSPKHSDIPRMIKHGSYKYLALDYHLERRNRGKDTYEAFEPEAFEGKTLDEISDRRVFKDIIFSFLKSRSKGECRNYSRLYFKRFGFDIDVVYYLFRSFLM